MENLGTKEMREIAWDIIYNRRSVRKFTDKPVSDEDLKLILEAGRWAPSGEDAQPWRFIVVRDEERRKKLGKISAQGSGRRFSGEFITKNLHKRFAGLEDEEKKKAIFKKLTSGDVSAFAGEAPVVIVVIGKKDVWDLPFDTSAAIENMLLMTTALGLGACWVIAPCIDIRDELKLKELLEVPEEYKVISIIPLGHMDRLPRPRPRIELNELTFDEKYGKPFYQE
ncbi:MAG: nitroreductase family protein [Bacillota bacterium]|jgi:nitroreductase|nr:nitroreductase family protein [Bacillota bacterium]